MSRKAPAHDDWQSTLCLANDLVRRATWKVALRIRPRGFAPRHEPFDKGDRLRVVRHDGGCATSRRLGFGVLAHAPTIGRIARASPEFRYPFEREGTREARGDSSSRDTNSSAGMELGARCRERVQAGATIVEHRQLGGTVAPCALIQHVEDWSAEGGVRNDMLERAENLCGETAGPVGQQGLPARAAASAVGHSTERAGPSC